MSAIDKEEEEEGIEEREELREDMGEIEADDALREWERA